jgi:hypothetical protein
MKLSQGARKTRSHWRAPDGNEYPIVDAHPDLMVLIQPTDDDIACAKPKDPNQCALAQAWMRQAHVPAAQIGIDKCYLLVREAGKTYALRLKTNKETRDKLDHFDKTKEMPDDGFWLLGIPVSERMDSQRAQNKRHRERWDDLRDPPAKRKKYRKLHLRNASRRAQTYRD